MNKGHKCNSSLFLRLSNNHIPNRRPTLRDKSLSANSYGNPLIYWVNWVNLHSFKDKKGLRTFLDVYWINWFNADYNFYSYPRIPKMSDFEVITLLVLGESLDFSNLIDRGNFNHRRKRSCILISFKVITEKRWNWCLDQVK